MERNAACLLWKGHIFQIFGLRLHRWKLWLDLDWVSAKLYLLPRVFVIHLLSFFKPAWCSNFSKLSDSLVNIYFYFSLLETVLRECLTLLFFHRSCCPGCLLFLNYDLFVESSRNMDIRQFMKRNGISDSWSVENISDKRLRIEVQPAQTSGVEL